MLMTEVRTTKQAKSKWWLLSVQSCILPWRGQSFISNI